MANRRNKQIDGLVNPAVINGFTVIADDITADSGAVITITFPAKTIWTVMAQTTGTAVTKTKSVASNGIGTVTLTLDGDGTVSYIIIASNSDTVADLDISTDSTYSITPTP